MNSQKRIRDYKIKIGNMKTGNLNSITDIKGIKVGHFTLDDKDIKTGITTIIPHQGNLFKEKLVAASYVINGFGKSIGLTQINELGTLETPIVLTNTLNVGIMSDGLIEYMLKSNEDIGITTGTINPVVCECNDGFLNGIRKRHLTNEHLFKSISNASNEFYEGDIGAGKGMSCFGLKGGIGTSSRIIELNNNEYTIASLVLTNYGVTDDFRLNGKHIGPKIKGDLTEENGSIIVIIATDIPLSYRQLLRVIKRANVGILRTGSYIGHGSGEVVIGFTTASKINHYEEKDIIDINVLNENKINILFKAVAESVEESILNSMITANKVVGRNGHIRQSLTKYVQYF